MTNYLKIINVFLFVLLFIYNFSNVKILDKKEKNSIPKDVNNESTNNNSIIYNEEEYKNLLNGNKFITFITFFILLSIFNNNFHINNEQSNFKFDNNNLIYDFFNFINNSSTMKLLFSFNISLLLLQNPYLLIWIFIIIILEILKITLTENCNRNGLFNTFSYLMNNSLNKFLIIFNLPRNIINKIGNGIILIYIILIFYFISIIILNNLLEKYNSNIIFWINLIILILTLLLLIIKILIFKNNNFSICDFLIDFNQSSKLNESFKFTESSKFNQSTKFNNN